MQQDIGPSGVGGIVGDGNFCAVSHFIQRCVGPRVNTGGNGRDGTDGNQITVVIGVKVFGVCRVLFHVHIHIAVVQGDIGSQQVGKVDSFQGVALLL